MLTTKKNLNFNINFLVVLYLDLLSLMNLSIWDLDIIKEKILKRKSILIITKRIFSLVNKKKDLII